MTSTRGVPINELGPCGQPVSGPKAIHGRLCPREANRTLNSEWTSSLASCGQNPAYRKTGQDGTQLLSG